MSKDLPTRGFRWAYEIDLTKKNICWVSEDEIDSTKKSNKGLILEVDLDYPEHFHDKHNDYPLAQERLEIKNHMLSYYCKKFIIKVRGILELLSFRLKK